ncbi:MAG: hypothetical protein ABIQ12_05925 [Opitutaceae bacterium]
MVRLVSRLLVLTTLLATLVCIVGAAQPAAAEKPAILAEAKPEQSATPATPKRTRVISPEVAAALAAATPKYTPPPPKPPPPPPEEELPDARDLDKPKNAIVRLPKYIVREQKPVIFSERVINTEKGLTDIAMKRYISDVDRALNLTSLPFIGRLSEARALVLYSEDERLKNMADLRDAGINAGKVDSAAGSYILKESQSTYMRTSDFGWGGSGSKGWTNESADAIRAESARRK